MIKRKKTDFLESGNLSFLFVGPPDTVWWFSRVFENAMCVEVKRLIFDKIALRENPSFRDMSSVLANQCESACKRNENLAVRCEKDFDRGLSLCWNIFNGMLYFEWKGFHDAGRKNLLFPLAKSVKK